MNRTERMKAILSRELEASHIELRDESAAHVGHAGAQPGGETHYQLVVESPRFAGMSRVARHQAIYQLLGKEFDSGLHALAIQAYAPGERKA